jgi:hypothetical protein
VPWINETTTPLTPLVGAPVVVTVVGLPVPVRIASVTRPTVIVIGLL